MLQKHESSLPNCESLHRDIQFSWEVFGPAITIEIAARIGNTVTILCDASSLNHVCLCSRCG